MTPAPLRVIKLGGSLLDWPEWPAALRSWCRLQPPSVDVLIVGGGAIVEALRALDRRHHFPPEAAHWLAIRAMGLTAAIAAQFLPEASLVTSLAEIPRTPSGAAVLILNVEQFLRDDVHSPSALPCEWQVTSDSIAARITQALSATELVLLKSAIPPPGTTRQSWSDSGHTDPYFPRASRHLPVRLVHLRAPHFPQVTAP